STEARPSTTPGYAVSHARTTPGAIRGDPVPEREPLRELTLGRRTPAPALTPHAPGVPDRAEADDDDLGRIEARCRAKADAARWAARRRRRSHEGDEARV